MRASRERPQLTRVWLEFLFCRDVDPVFCLILLCFKEYVVIVVILRSLFLFCFKIGHHYLAQAVLEFAMLPRLSQNSQFSCLSFLYAGITGSHSHTWTYCLFALIYTYFQLPQYIETNIAQINELSF